MASQRIICLTAAGLFFGSASCSNKPRGKADSPEPLSTRVVVADKQRMMPLTLSTLGKPAKFMVEVVASAEAVEQGLMYRRTMAPDEGMLFIMGEEKRQMFWMKNTFIPLDMVFLDHNRQVVGIVENTEPHSLDGRGVRAASSFVLELNAGTARRLGIAPGSLAEWGDYSKIVQ